jgi:6-phosphogluconolactonase (cycloisomerase 2 family)
LASNARSFQARPIEVFKMNAISSSPRRIFAVLCLSLLLACTAFAQGTVPKFLFVGNYIDGTISVFQIQPLTGQLTPVAGSPFPGGAAIQGMALAPGNKFLYTAGNSVTAFSVNQQNGSLTQIASSPLVDGSGKLIITPNGKFAYAMGNGIFAFAIDSITGTLTAVPGSPFYASVAFGGAAADPSSQYFYAAALIPYDIRAYSIQEDGALFPLTPSPYPDDGGPIDVATEPSGRFVYVANYDGTGISGYAIAPGQGTLTLLPGSPYPTGGQASNAITAAPDGTAIIIDNQVQSTTASLAIQTDGSLVMAGTPQTAAYNPRGVTVDPTSEFVYTSSNNANAVSAYRLDPVSEALEPVPGLQWPTGSNPYALTVLAASNPPYCPLNNVEPSVTLCAPTTSSRSPVRIVAGTTSASAVKEITVLVDGVVTFSNAGSEAMDIFVDVPQGEQTLTVEALNTAGQKFSLVRGISVSGSDSASCADRGIVPTVGICTPLGGSVTGASINVIATAHSDGTAVIASTAVYLDGKKVYSVASGTVNTYINAASGSHQIKVQSTDSSGFSWSSTVYVTTE